MSSAIDAYVATLSRRVMCANNFEEGVKRLPPLLAATYRHIQVNSRWRLDFLAFDVDRADAGNSHVDAELPAPTYMMRNPQNGHAHLLYQLATPVLVGRGRRPAPQAFYKDVDAGMTIQLGADPSYTKAFIKTPGHSAWETTYTAAQYELAELKDYLAIDMNAAQQMMSMAKGSIDQNSRNASLFNLLRKWCYRVVKEYRREGSFSEFYEAAHQKAEMLMSAISLEIEDKPALPVDEQMRVVDSVTKWAWNTYTGRKGSDDPEFKRLQQAAAQKRWGDNSQKKRLASRYRNQGMSFQKVADRLDISKSTVIRWYNGNK